MILPEGRVRSFDTGHTLHSTTIDSDRRCWSDSVRVYYIHNFAIISIRKSHKTRDKVAGEGGCYISEKIFLQVFRKIKTRRVAREPTRRLSARSVRVVGVVNIRAAINHWPRRTLWLYTYSRDTTGRRAVCFNRFKCFRVFVSARRRVIRYFVHSKRLPNL